MALVHPLLGVLVRQPHLLVEHLSGYAALAHAEAGTTGGQLLRRAVAWGLCGACTLLGLVLAGMAALLGAVTGVFHWALVVVPGVPLLLALAAGGFAARSRPGQAFGELRAQLATDLQALRTLGGKP